MSELTVVGQSVKRLDSFEKVTGKAKYVMDMKLPAMLYGKILRSPYPHAKITSIDSAQAARLGGVKAVITGRDVPDRRFGIGVYDQHVLARERVLFAGDAVAAVAASTDEIAEVALGLIEVEYEELPAVFDAEEAASATPPVVLHPDLYSYQTSVVVRPRFDRERPNVHNHFKIRSGDIAKGFQGADLVVENRFTTAMIQHCQFEPHVSIAQVEGDGTITVWSSVQGLYMIKSALCDALGLPSSRVRIIAPYVGGGFGGKISIRTEPVSVLLARKTGRPVKVAFSREEVFTSANTRSPFTIYIKDGVKRDGTLVAREIRQYLNGGGYADYVYLVTRNSAFGAVGSYRVPNFKLDSYGVYTNLPMGGPFRGFGSSEILWAIESQMDLIAEKLGLDPLEIRLKNVLREGDVNVTGEKMHSVGAQECLRKAAEAIEWGKKPAAGQGPWRRGKGIAHGNKYSIAPTASCAYLKVHDDETIEVRMSADEMGQGVKTVMAQIAAEEFGLSVDRVRVIHGDTAFTPYDMGSVSSRSTYNTGNAVRLACQDAKHQLFAKAAVILEASPDDLETSKGQVYVRGAPERAVQIRDLFSPTMFASGKFLEEGGEIIGKATWYQPATPEDPETGQGERLCAFYIYGAQGAEVEVNTETGEVRVVRISGAFDVGRPINPKMCEAQIEGGVGMGIGSALYEEMVFDNGRLLNPTFMDYKIPTVMEIPTAQNVRPLIVEAPHREGPFGAKGVGEAVMTPSAPAIANAVYNAVGVRIKDLPITREKVLRALRPIRT